MSIGSIGIQALTGSSGTPQQTASTESLASSVSERKIDTSPDSTSTASMPPERSSPPPGLGTYVDHSV